MTLQQNTYPDAVEVRHAGDQIGAGSRWALDPLDDDGFDDEVVVTSTRRMLRLAVAAVDVGARFTREGLTVDPAAWMIAPRNLFEGLPPIEAVQDLTCFRRSVLLHGLALGLDADPEDLDDLLGDDVEAQPSGPPEPNTMRLGVTVERRLSV